MLKSAISTCSSIMELKCLITYLLEMSNPHPGLIFFVLLLCRQKIKNKITSWYHLEISERALLDLLHQAHLRQVRQQLTDILAKNQQGLLTKADAEELSGIAEELNCRNINEEELGFTAESLQAITNCIRQGECYRAAASN